MFLGLRTVIYHAPDLAKAKAWYTAAFGVAPYFDERFYVGFEIAPKLTTSLTVRPLRNAERLPYLAEREPVGLCGQRSLRPLDGFVERFAA